MKRATSRRNPLVVRRGMVAVAASAVLLAAACGGGDDDDADATTTTTTLAVATTTTIPVTPATTPATDPTTTLPTAPDLTTDGATVVVANSSSINGAAGRLSDRLAVAGFSVGTPTNGSEGQLEVTKIYFDPSNESAQAVAESVRLALGGGDIALFEMGVPAPVESGDIGDASIVVSMGNDVTDKSLEELQGLVPATDEATDDAEADDAEDEG